MKEKFLPIGTVVKLKGSDKKIMITEFLVFSRNNKDSKIYEYGACPYPTGLEKNVAIGFNHDSIEEVVHMGYVDEEFKKLNDFFKENEEKIRNEIKTKLSNK